MKSLFFHQPPALLSVAGLLCSFLSSSIKSCAYYFLCLKAALITVVYFRLSDYNKSLFTIPSTLQPARPTELCCSFSQHSCAYHIRTDKQRVAVAIFALGQRARTSSHKRPSQTLRADMADAIAAAPGSATTDWTTFQDAGVPSKFMFHAIFFPVAMAAFLVVPGIICYFSLAFGHRGRIQQYSPPNARFGESPEFRPRPPPCTLTTHGREGLQEGLNIPSKRTLK